MLQIEGFSRGFTKYLSGYLQLGLVLFVVLTHSCLAWRERELKLNGSELD